MAGIKRTLQIVICVLVISMFGMPMRAKAENGYAMFPMKTLNITKGEAGHNGRKIVDNCGKDGGIENFYAPFDGHIVRKAFGSANDIIIESDNKVKWADGTYDYVHMWLAHDNDISNVYVGMKFKQGEVIYQEGTTGYAYGNHVHMICGRGKYPASNGLKAVASTYANTLTNEVYANKVLCLYNDTVVKGTGGYSWSKISDTMKAAYISSFPFENGQEYIIRSALSGKAMEISDGNTAYGNKINIWDYLGSPWQRWKAVKCSDGYEFVNVSTGQAMDIRDMSTSEGAILQQYIASENVAQRFYVIDAGGGKYGLINVNSDMALDLCCSNMSNGAFVDQHPYHGKDNQLWTFECVGKKYTLHFVKHEGVASVPGDQTAAAGVKLPATCTAETGYHLTKYEGTNYNGTATDTWTACNGLSTYTDTWTMNANRTIHVYAEPNTYNLCINPNGGAFSDGVTTYKDAPTRLVYKSFNWCNISSFIPTRYGYVLDGFYTASVGGTKVYNADGSACYDGYYWTSSGYSRPDNLGVYAHWTQLDTVPPVITQAAVSGVDDTGFTVTAYATDNVALYDILFPVRIENSSWDWQWMHGTRNADGSYSYKVKYSDFKNEEGVYVVDLYAYDTSGNHSECYRVTYDTGAIFDVNSIIDGNLCYSGMEGFTFDVSIKNTAGKDVSGEYGIKSAIDFVKRIPVGYTYTVTPKGNVSNYVANEVSGTVTYNMSATAASPSWTAITYQIRYDANGGSGAPGIQAKKVDETIWLSSNEPTKPGFLFNGWNTKANGSGSAYRAGAIYKTNKDVTLYAQWKENKAQLIKYANTNKITDRAYTGAPIEPTVIVTMSGEELVRGVDYVLSYENNVNAGKAQITITGIGIYSGSKVLTFNITGKSIGSASVKGIVSKNYDGTAQTQENLVVEFKGDYLVKGQDYTVSYTNNVNVGTATVVVTGKGKYSGTIKKNFKITAYDMKADEKHMISVSSLSSADLSYTKGGVTPNVIVRFGNTQLVKGKDYTISYTNNKAVTKNEKKPFVITIKGKGNYKGTVKQEYFITPKSVKDVSISLGNVLYSKKAGNYIVQPFVFDTNGKKLAATDYTIAYNLADGTPLTKKSVVSAGTTVFITIAGKGNYSDYVVLRYQVIEK